MFTPLRRLAPGLASVALILGAAPAALAFHTFSDVPTTSEFHGYISNLHDKGIISGVTSTTFEPMRNMSRAEVSKVVVRAKGMPINTSGGPHFADVASNNEFYPYIETLANANVVSGFGDGYFRPQWNVTRGEFSKIVTRTWTIPIDLAGAPHFDDMGEASPAYQYVETLYNNGIINGYPDETFRQDSPILRQEVAKMVDRTMSKTSFNTGTGARMELMVVPSTAVANCTQTVTYSLTSYDAFGNLDTENNEAYSATTTLGTFVGSGTTTQAGSFQDGLATFQLRSCQAGTAEVTVTSFESMTVTRSATFTQDPAQSSNTFQVTANPMTVEADCTTTSTVTFTVRDSQNNTLTSYSSPVTATISGGGRFIASGGNAQTGTTTQTVTASSGTGSFLVASCLAGANTITFQAPNVQTQTANMTFTASPGMTPATVTLSPSSCVETSGIAGTYTMTIMSGASTPLQGAGVVLTSTGTPTVTISPTGSQTTNASGQISLQLTGATGSATGIETLNAAITPSGGSTTTLTTPLDVQASC